MTLDDKTSHLLVACILLPSHSARYWSTDFKNNCPVYDDTDGISLRSVGGIFIGTVIGLALAMIVFLFEVCFNFSGQFSLF